MGRRRASDTDGYVLSAHRGESQGRPRTTAGSRPIGYQRPALTRFPGTAPKTRSRNAPRPTGRLPAAVSSPDNGSAYVSAVHAIACRALGIRHLRTRPYRPQTNGKAERFIRTMLGGWAYGAIYRSSQERTAALDGWLHHYNHHRPHGALSHRPPIARLNELNNLLGS